MEGLELDAGGRGVRGLHIPLLTAKAFGRGVDAVLAARRQPFDLEAALGVGADWRTQIRCHPFGMEKRLCLGIGKGFAVEVADAAGEG